MECSQAKSLIPSYLDGELSEAQAAPLRKHLLDCQPCRAGAQGEKNLKRWFVASEAVAVPQGFAARVARRAFAGDTGDRFGEPVRAGAGRDGEQESGLRFVLQITSIAALILIVLSVALKSLQMPSGANLRASGVEPSLEQAIEEADRLERREARDAHVPSARRTSKDDARTGEGRKP